MKNLRGKIGGVCTSTDAAVFFSQADNNVTQSSSAGYFVHAAPLGNSYCSKLSAFISMLYPGLAGGM